MAKEYGFSSAEEFKTHLETKIQEAGTETKPEENKESQPIHTIRNVHIVDRSGSMYGQKLTNAIKGVNHELAELKKDKTINYTQTIVAFDHSMYYIQNEVPIAQAEPIKFSSGGSTALYDTIGTVLEGLIESGYEGKKTLVKIFTDGEENSSRGKYRDPSELKKLIQKCEDEYEFTITFVGTEWDIDSIIENIGIDITNTLFHDNTPRGVKMSYGQTVNSTRSYVDNVKQGKDVKKNFYKKRKQ
jgi:Mg-chelatase subunit ChlD